MADNDGGSTARRILREESLSALFEDLGIKYVIDNQTAINWGPIELETLDARILQASAKGQAFDLFYTAKPPNTERYRRADDWPVDILSGPIEQPRMSIGKLTIILLGARYHDGRIYVRFATDSRTKRSSKENQRELSVRELRALSRFTKPGRWFGLFGRS